jgi:PAS domain S-box-containing protein
MSADRPHRDSASDGGAWTDTHRDREAIVAELDELLVQGGAGVVATDLEGVITHWTTGAWRLYGWSAEEAIGRHVLDLLVARDDREAAAENLETIRTSGGWEGEFDLVRKDGSIVSAYTRGTVIKDDAGRPVGLLGLSMDVSALPPSGLERESPA